MTRSSSKLPFTARALQTKYAFLNPLLKDNTLKTKHSINHIYQRSSTILPEMIGSSVQVHTGQKFVKLVITEHTIGFKFGEFAPTKKRAQYKKKKKKR
jgi:small subunit ribosomal protein S19